MGSSRGIVAYVLDGKIIASEFEFKSRDYLHLRTDILVKGRNLSHISPNGLDIKQGTKLDMPLNKRKYTINYSICKNNPHVGLWEINWFS